MMHRFNPVNRIIPLLIILVTASPACKKEIEGLPKVKTSPVTNIFLSGLIGGGTITSDGGSPITARGVCWSDLRTPTTEDSKTSDGTGVGSFASSMTEMTPNTLYYIRAYATNSLGTGYGNTLTVATGALLDVEGNVYRIIPIGNQVWMVENLRTTKYNDGTDIPLVTDPTEWAALTSPGVCWSNNDEGSYKSSGALYNWYAATDSRLCPVGWHVPSQDEWNDLIKALNGVDVTGGKLKETGTEHWVSPNTGATNESGFTGLPGSFRSGLNGSYGSFGYFGYWWSSTEVDGMATLSWSEILQFNNVKLNIQGNKKSSGLFVRCIKD